LEVGTTIRGSHDGFVIGKAGLQKWNSKGLDRVDEEDGVDPDVGAKE
jgi:hypothetical protein